MLPALSYVGVLAVVLATVALGYLAWRWRGEGRGLLSRSAHFEQAAALAAGTLTLAIAVIWAIGVRGRRPLLEGLAFLAVGGLGVGYALVVARRLRRMP